MVEVEKTGTPKLRKLFTQREMHSGYEFRVHNHSYKNLRRGLLERVFYVEKNKELVPCPSPEANVFAELKYLGKRFGNICGFHAPISAEQFVDCYSGRKRTIYQQAAESLTERALEWKDGSLKTFVKAEKFNISLKPDPAPRVIQPRSPRYNVELGKYLKKYEHKAYKSLDKIWGGPTVMKGYTMDEIGMHIRGAWDQFQIPVAIGFDMSRFDQHVSVPALVFEHQCYLRSFKGDYNLKDLLAMQLTNHGVGFASDGMIRYTKKGCRMSGDMNTALGNCLLACLITKHIMKGKRSRLINNGDDCVLICEQSDVGFVVSNLTTQWSRFGFNCIAETPVYEIEEIRFCQMAPIYDGKSWVMVREPSVQLSKDAFSLTHWNSVKNAKQWFKAVGQCGVRVAGGIPVVQEYYQAYIRNAGDVNDAKMNRDLTESGFWMMSKGSKRGYGMVSEECRFSFWKAFGVTPDQQIALENHLSQVRIDCELETPYENPADILQWIMK